MPVRSSTPKPTTKENKPGTSGARWVLHADLCTISTEKDGGRHLAYVTSLIQLHRPTTADDCAVPRTNSPISQSLTREHPHIDGAVWLAQMVQFYVSWISVRFSVTQFVFAVTTVCHDGRADFIWWVGQNCGRVPGQKAITTSFQYDLYYLSHACFLYSGQVNRRNNRSLNFGSCAFPLLTIPTIVFRQKLNWCLRQMIIVGWPPKDTNIASTALQGRRWEGWEVPQAKDRA